MRVAEPLTRHAVQYLAMSLLACSLCVLQAPTQLTWIERLREWLASELLQPLAQHIMTAHELPNQAISAFGQNNAKVGHNLLGPNCESCQLLRVQRQCQH